MIVSILNATGKNMKPNSNDKTLLLSPFTPISKNIASHRAAQGIIYADQIKRSGIDINVSMSGNLKNIHDYNTLYVYHGNDWGGSLNLFGGLKDYANIDNFKELSKFRGKVYSICITFPNYHEMIQNRMLILSTKGKQEDINPTWHEVDWDNLKHIQDNAEVIDPNLIMPHDKISCGDSHAISMYRPGWMINSVPFKTLYGAIKEGLNSFIYNNSYKFKQLEFYFGNIDIRHHLCRQNNPEQSTRKLVKNYFDAVKQLNISAQIYEPLPIEHESRPIPKTGWYKGTPFYGSWKERNDIRTIFINECKTQQTDQVKLFEWTSHMINKNNELDFSYMEKPKSVHLSREFYPHWQGKEYNNTHKNTTLEDFFT